MPAQFKVGQFVCRSGTGSQAVTGIGFQPKALIVWGQLPTGTFLTSFDYSNYGLADGNGNQLGGSATENDAGAVDVNSAVNNQVIYGISYNGSAEMVATLLSMDADGFTLNWTNNAFGSACGFNYVAIGGTGVSAFVGSVACSTGVASQAVTGIGFRPDVLLGFHGPLPAGQSFAAARQSFGWCDSGLRQGCSLVTSKLVSPSKTRRLQRSDGMFVQVDDSNDTVTVLGAVSSFDADGFTVNWIVQPSTINSIYFLAIKGVSAHAGTFNQPTSTGNQSITGVGFTPQTVLMQSIGQVTSSGLLTGYRFTRAAIDASVQITAWCGSENNVSTASSTRAGSTAKALQLYTERATLNADATRVSLDSDGWTLNWGTVDATVRQMLYLALAPGAPPTITSVSPSSGTIDGGTAITVTGTGFTGVTSLTLGGNAVTSLVVVSDTQMTAVTPSHAAGAVTVAATNLNGTGTLVNGYTYVICMTGRTLGYEALRMCREGLLRAGRLASVEQLADTLLRLNDLIAGWALQDLLIYTVVRTTKTLASGTASYTIGSGGAIDIVRPDFIIGANLILDINATPQTEQEIALFTDQQWEAIPQKSLTNRLVQGVYYDHGLTSGRGTLSVYPIPTVGTTQLVLYSLQAIGALADLATCYSFPPGYAELLRYALAIRIAPEFGGLIDPRSVHGLYARALARVKRINQRPVEAMLDARLPGCGGRPREARG